MFRTVELPLWLLLLILVFATASFASHFLFPSVRWFLRRRLEKAVARLNTRLERPIQPFKLARRYDMIQRLIYDPGVGLAIAEHAKAEGIPENVAFEEARRYAREIVPSFSASLYFGIAIRLARWLSTSLYRVRLGYYDEAALRQMDPDATVIFVMNHRSNMDYVLVTYLAAERSALSYAVGEWARVWPLSRLIRAMGAYFIRRRSRNELYRKVLARYVAMATAGGVTQAMFPEGGLSLDGRIAPPKLGLLKYIVDGFDAQGRDVLFVPVALNYDRVLEDRILIAAEERGDRRFRARISVVAGFALKQIWLRLTGRYHKFGYAAVSFGDPVSLRAFIATHPKDRTRDLARLLVHRIGQVVPALPVPMVAHILTGGQTMTRAEIEQAFSALLTRLDAAHVHLPRNNRDYAVDFGLRGLTGRGMVRETPEGFHAVAEQSRALAFYANSIAHLFEQDFAPAARSAAPAGS